MTDLFAGLVQRARGEAGLRPALPPRFDARPQPGEPWGEIEEFVPVGGRPPGSRPAARPQAPPAGADVPHAGAPLVQSKVADRPESPAAAPRDPAGPVTPAEGDRQIHEVSEPPADAPVIDVAALVNEALAAHLRQPVERPSPEPAFVIVDAAPEAQPAPTVARPLMTVQPSLPHPSAMAAPAVPPPAAPAIEVRIGRIEITAAPAPARPQPAAPAPVPRTRALSLGDYLARRRRR